MLELVTGGELFDRFVAPGTFRNRTKQQELPGPENPHVLFVSRIVERGYYSERDAAHVIKQILEAVAVMSSPPPRPPQIFSSDLLVVAGSCSCQTGAKPDQKS